jgi:SAM-dependent methyltransferase
MTEIDPEQQRADSRAAWERASEGWGKRADRIRDWGMPVSVAMVDALALQPGQTVLELAAGPGDTGFLAAELIQPGGTLICSDGAEAMLDVARARADARGLRNVEFRQLELEWIDLETASVDGVLCRWGIMLIVDPETAAREIRRVLGTGKRAAFAVWDDPERNPWATIPGRTLIAHGHSVPPDPNAPGMFTLAPPGRLDDLLGDAGFTEVVVKPVELSRRYPQPTAFLAETLDMSQMFGAVYRQLANDQQAAVAEDVIDALGPYTSADGTVTIPGSSLVAVATA